MVVLLAIAALLGLVYWLFMSPYSQTFGRYIWRIKTDQKVVALTFDDGPNEPYTSEILDILSSHKIKATFFMVGKCVERYPATAKRVLKEGHVVGNHSVSHQFHRYLTRPYFKREVEENQAILKNELGVTPALFRSPWLWRQPLLFRTLKRNNLTPISGEFCHPLEPIQVSGGRIAKHVLKRAKPGSIIIFHDGFDARGGNRAETVKAVKIVVEKLARDGYKFETIDRLLGIPAYQ